MSLTFNKSSLKKGILVSFASAITFYRLLYAGEAFSYDYDAYLLIIQKLNALPLSDMLGANFVFPYVVIRGVTPIELGFSLLVKALGVVIGSPAALYAVIAAFSVGLRVYVMKSMGVPLVWIVVMNLIAITLFEANAIRLGIATSVLMMGLFWLLARRSLLGYMAIAFSISIHLQIILFIFPLFSFFFLYPWLRRSKVRLLLVFAASVLGSFIFTKILPSISNLKIQEYVSRGSSDSAGLTALSLFSILFAVACALGVSRSDLKNDATKLWAAIIAAFICSVVLLLSLTSVAVIGTRTWQVAFIVMSTFIFYAANVTRVSKSSYIALMILTVLLFVNVFVRYPLSNLVSPPFPGVTNSISASADDKRFSETEHASKRYVKYHAVSKESWSQDYSGKTSTRGSTDVPLMNKVLKHL